MMGRRGRGVTCYPAVANAAQVHASMRVYSGGLLLWVLAAVLKAGRLALRALI